MIARLQWLPFPNIPPCWENRQCPPGARMRRPKPVTAQIEARIAANRTIVPLAVIAAAVATVAGLPVFVLPLCARRTRDNLYLAAPRYGRGF